METKTDQINRKEKRKMNEKQQEWDKSYEKGDNFLFYPDDNIIRMVSKYIKKRIDINKYQTYLFSKEENLKCLDLGCGIGRHVFFLNDLNIEAYGIDLSKEAVNYAKKWGGGEKFLKEDVKEKVLNRFFVGSSTALPWTDEYFDAIISNGVIDSMSYEIADLTLKEAYRVLKKNGILILSLIQDENQMTKELEVEDDMEHGTYQTYWTKSSLEAYMKNKFEIIDAIIEERRDLNKQFIDCRVFYCLKRL